MLLTEKPLSHRALFIVDRADSVMERIIDVWMVESRFQKGRCTIVVSTIFGTCWKGDTKKYCLVETLDIKNAFTSGKRSGKLLGKDLHDELLTTLLRSETGIVVFADDVVGIAVAKHFEEINWALKRTFGVIQLALLTHHKTKPVLMPSRKLRSHREHLPLLFERRGSVF